MIQLPSRSRRGFALMVVISVMALIVVYLVTAQTMVSSAHNQKRLFELRLERTEAQARLVSALARPGAPAQMTFEASPNRTATATRRDLAPSDPVWKDLPGLAQRPGDALIAIQWNAGPAAQRVDRYLVNPVTPRPGGAIHLPSGISSASETAPAATSATLTQSPTPTATPSPTPEVSPTPQATATPEPTTTPIATPTPETTPAAPSATSTTATLASATATTTSPALATPAPPAEVQVLQQNAATVISATTSTTSTDTGR